MQKVVIVRKQNQNQPNKNNCVNVAQRFGENTDNFNIYG